MLNSDTRSAAQGLLQASAFLLSKHELPDLLQSILNIAQEMLAADGYAVWRREDGSTNWHIEASRGLSERYIGTSGVITGAYELPDSPILLDDLHSDPRLAGRMEALLAEGILAVGAFPIVVDQVPSGTIVFYFRQPYRFAPKEIEYASTVANLAGAAIANAELIQRQNEASRRAELLATVTSLFNSSLDFDRVVQAVADAVVPSLADWCGLSLYVDGQIKRVAVAHHDPEMIAVADELELRFPEKLTPERGTLKVLMTGEPELMTGITDEMLAAAAESPEHLDLLRRLKICSIITVPLMRAGKAIGVLRLVSSSERRSLSQSEVLFAQEMAARAANALENARLHRVQSAAAAQLQKLNVIGQRLAAELDRQKLIQTITDIGTDGTGAQFGAFFYNVTNDAGERYMLYTLSGVDRSHFERFPMPRNTEVFGPTFRGEGVVRSADITQDPRYGKNAPYCGMPAGHLPVRSYLAVPVRRENGSIAGGLFFGHKDASVFTEEAEKFAEAVANQATIALTNAELYERVHKELAARIEAEKKLDRERNFLALAQRVANAGSFELDLKADPVTAVWSPELMEMYGLPKERSDNIFYQTWIDSLHPDDRDSALESIRTAIEERGAWQQEFRIVRPDGTVRWMSGRGQCLTDADGSPRTLIGINLDVTERRAAEAALLRAEKLSSAGRLAASIAHEINNPLEAVTNLLFLARSTPSPEKERMLDAADRELQRIAHITRQTLGFYRETAAPREFELDATIHQVLALLNSRLQRCDVLPRVQLDTVGLEAVEGEIRQVLSNLIINAADASAVGGSVTIRTRRGWIHDNGRQRRAVRISVADHGEGIGPEQLKRIFEPFFTTKKDLGTGLGLWVVREIIAKHSGKIQLRSRPGSGTVVSVLLPLLQSPVL